MNADRFDLPQDADSVEPIGIAEPDWRNSASSRGIGSAAASRRAAGSRQAAKLRDDLAGDLAERLGEHLEFLLARARPAPDQRDPAETVVAIAAAGHRRRCRRGCRLRSPSPGRRSGRGRCRPSAPECAARCPSSPPRRAAPAGCRRTSAWSLRQWPSSSSSSRFSSIAPGSTSASPRRLAAREGDEQPVVEQARPCRRRRRRKGMASSTQSSWPRCKRVAGRLAGLLAQVELEVGPFGCASRGSIAGSRKGAMVGMTPMRSSPCSGWPSARARSASSSLSRRTRTALSAIFWPERREADDAPGALDQGDAQQGLQLAQAGGQGRLGDEAGLGGLAEMAVLAKRDQILELLDRRQVDGHRNNPIRSARYNRLERLMSAAELRLVSTR